MNTVAKSKLLQASMLATGLFIAAATPGVALAQTDPAADATQSGINEIVVTAEKRETSAQKTAIAMDVFASDTLERDGVKDLSSLANVSPSINFAQNQAAAIITIRGVSSRDDSEVGDPAVAVSTDGFYTQRPVGLGATMFDLERIEVLRGPQGTLYGRNATGGAINVITRKPVLGETSGYAAMTVGNFDTLNFEGALNVPIGDTLAVRVSGTRREHDGYTRLSPVADGDDEDSKAARIHLLWQPTSRFKALLSASALRQDGVGPQGVGIDFVTAGNGDITHLKPEIPGFSKTFGSNTQGYTNVNIDTYQWQTSYEFDPLTVSYLGGYSKMTFRRQTDLDGTADVSEGFNQNENPETWNHELRISSNGNGPFKWQTGVFYFRESNRLYSVLQTFASDGSAFNWGIFDFNRIRTTSKAIFGQASYTLASGLTLEGGLRYSDDKKLRQGSMTFYGFNIPEDSRASSSALTWHAAANWQLNPDNMVYIKADKGYKAGGFNNGSAYDPEYLYAYEAGTKNYFFDRTLMLNANAFYYNYIDMQVKQFVGSVEREIIRNAGKAELYGAELQAIYQPTPADSIELSAAYLRARFKQLAVSNGSGGNDDLAGNVLQQAPTWSLNGAYQHTFEMAHGELVARAQTSYRTATYLTIYNYPDDRQGAYTKSDITLTYSDKSGWDLQAFARNLENTKVINVVAENPGYGSIYYQFGAPRTYGVRASVKL